MKTKQRVIIAAGIAAVLALVPVAVSALWLAPAPGLGPWRHAYVHDPSYRFGPPSVRNYARDLHLYGPVYADWHQRQRNRGWWW